MSRHVSPPKTLLAADDLRGILRQYSLRLRDFTAIPQGTINSNYCVQSDEGPLFLRVCEGKSLADVAFESSLIWHLGSRGLRTPPLWRTRSGSPFVPFRPGQPAMLFSWIEGRQLTDVEIDETYAFHIGELLAKLHLATDDLRHDHVGIYTSRHLVQRLQHMRQDAQAHAAVGPVLTSLADELQWLGRMRLTTLPRGIGHSDLFPDNLLFPSKPLRRNAGNAQTPAEHSGWVLDLEQAATVPRIYDLAVSLLACCAPVPELAMQTSTAPELDPSDAPRASEPPADASDVERVGPLCAHTARALVAGYQSLRALSPEEWLGLYAELRFAALRFTVTRLTDVHRYGSPQPRAVVAGKDFREFLWRLHRLIATPAEQLCAHLRQPF